MPNQFFARHDLDPSGDSGTSSGFDSPDPEQPPVQNHAVRALTDRRVDPVPRPVRPSNPADRRRRCARAPHRDRSEHHAHGVAPMRAPAIWIAIMPPRAAGLHPRIGSSQLLRESAWFQM
jgi:hypothetical protein